MPPSAILRLEIIAGPDAGRKVRLPDGAVLRLGKGPQAEISVSRDPYLSDLHLLLERRGDTIAVTDLGSINGWRLNDLQVMRGTARVGDRIEAGVTVLAVVAEASAAEDGASADAESGAGAAPALAAGKRLYAILDAARDVIVLGVMDRHGLKGSCLYEGDSAIDLAMQAPYLVEIPPDNGLAGDLLTEGKGKSWGVMLTSDAELDVVRKHLRHFLMVKVENGMMAYFRFYDPRVLRAYLPSCSPREVETFFGEISTYIVEDREGKMRRYSHKKGTLAVEAVEV